MEKNTGLFTALNFICFGTILLLASFVKCSFMVGSHAAFFSLTNSIAPFSALMAGNFGIMALILFRIFYASFFGSAGILVNVIPNVAASLYLASRSRIFQAAIPALCTFLFLIHPVGRYAPIYTCYWLIPITAALLRTRSIFFQFFATTFVAHAVGSVIWLYTIPMSAATWNALIPIVFVERIIITGGMIAFYLLSTLFALFVTPIVKRRFNFARLTLPLVLICAQGIIFAGAGGTDQKHILVMYMDKNEQFVTKTSSIDYPEILVTNFIKKVKRNFGLPLDEGRVEVEICNENETILMDESKEKKNKYVVFRQITCDDKFILGMIITGYEEEDIHLLNNNGWSIYYNFDESRIFEGPKIKVTSQVYESFLMSLPTIIVNDQLFIPYLALLKKIKDFFGQIKEIKTDNHKSFLNGIIYSSRRSDTQSELCELEEQFNGEFLIAFDETLAGLKEIFVEV